MIWSFDKTLLNRNVCENYCINEKKLNPLHIETLPTWEELMLYGKEVANLLLNVIVSLSLFLCWRRLFRSFKDLIPIDFHTARDIHTASKVHAIPTFSLEEECERMKHCYPMLIYIYTINIYVYDRNSGKLYLRINIQCINLAIFMNDRLMILIFYLNFEWYVPRWYTSAHRGVDELIGCSKWIIKFVA